MLTVLGGTWSPCFLGKVKDVTQKEPWEAPRAMSCLDSSQEVVSPTSSARICPSCHHSGWGSRDTGDARTQDVRNIQGREADLQDREAKATARCLLEMQIPGLRPDLQDPCLGFPVISQEI